MEGRIFYVVKEGRWVVTDIKNIKKDDLFKIFDDGVVVTDSKDNFIFEALNEAYINPKGQYEISYK